MSSGGPESMVTLGELTQHYRSSSSGPGRLHNIFTRYWGGRWMIIHIWHHPQRKVEQIKFPGLTAHICIIFSLTVTAGELVTDFQIIVHESEILPSPQKNIPNKMAHLDYYYNSIAISGQNLWCNWVCHKHFGFDFIWNVEVRLKVNHVWFLHSSAKLLSPLEKMWLIWNYEL